MSASERINFPGGFTVLMALYEGDIPDLFERAVSSVFTNTILPDVLLLVIDGPLTVDLENALRVLKQCHGEKLKVLRLIKNSGLANALNYGLNYIQTSWVIRADADDINLEHRFITLAKMIQARPDLKLIGSSILEVNELGHPLARRMVPSNMEAIKVFARRRNPFNHMSVAFERNAIQNLGAYPDIYLKEDYGLWCKCLAADVPMANTSEVLVWARAGNGMYRRRGGWRSAISEYPLQIFMVRLQLKSFAQALQDGLLRGAFFLIPASLRKVFYLGWLRSSVKCTDE